MKITDFALIFVAVTLPIIIIVYVNVSFTIKAEEQELYYKKIIDVAIQDATSQMKEVESNDPELDYGYSGSEDKKISVNAKIAVNTFFDSLYNNFNINGNPNAQRYLQTFIPAVAVIDYNGVYISSMESYDDMTKPASDRKVTMHTLKPKRYYTFSYDIVREGGLYKIYEAQNTPVGTTIISKHTVEFTMDDYVTHRGELASGAEIPVKSFYISDQQNNTDLASGAYGQVDIVKYLQDKRKEVIVDTIVKEIAYATNAANSYARSAGITYDFVFPPTTQDEMENAIENVGVFAFVQGLSIGNKYLNTKSYGTTKLQLANRYYFSVPTGASKYKTNLYHKDKNCPEYRVSDTSEITPSYVLTKQQAASARTSKLINGTYQLVEGYYPCQICRP